MHLSSNGERIAQGIEFNGNALAIAQFKTPWSPIPEPRPTIELKRSININELRHAITRYSDTINEPNVSLKISRHCRCDIVLVVIVTEQFSCCLCFAISIS
jgi:hypothetical protein